MANITVAQFRANFPEFANPARFPSGFIQFWMDWSYLMLNAQRFSTSLDMAAQLFTAHNCAIERAALDQALVAAKANRGTVGLTQGPVSSKSVDKVSISYDNAAALDPSAAHWNLTTYGNRLWELIKMFGAGPIQIGLPGPCAGFISWAGAIPPFWPGWWP